MSIGNIYDKIRKSREESSYSQKELAKIVGVSDKTISAYEAGRATPPVEKLQKIAKATNRPLSYFSSEGKEDFSIQAKLDKVEQELREIKELIKKKN